MLQLSTGTSSNLSGVITLRGGFNYKPTAFFSNRLIKKVVTYKWIQRTLELPGVVASTAGGVSSPG